MVGASSISDDFEIIEYEETSLGVEDLAIIREWLQPTDYMASSSELNRHLSSQAPGTGIWICNTQTYQRWHDSGTHALWIKGVPGAGKSVTAASLIQHLKEESVPVLFFFFRYITIANRKPRSLTRDWLAQLLPHSPRLQATLQPLIHLDLDTVSDDELWGYLLTGLSSVEKAYCVVDALDEMEQVPGDSLVRRLNSLASHGPKCIKLLMTSRPKQYLQSALRDTSIVHISLEQDLVGKDIALFVSNRLQNVLNDDQERLRDSLSSSICTRAQGLFLYARLLLDQILPNIISSEPLDVERLASTLPIGLEDMYNSMLLRQAESLKIDTSVQVFLLGCATHSYRPLRLNELADLLKFVHPSSQLGAANPKELTRSACAPLLEIAEDETIHVINHSFTEFLMDKQRSSSSRGKSPQFPALDPLTTHKMLSIQCLDYLQSGSLGPPEFTAEEQEYYESRCKCDDDPGCQRDHRTDPSPFNYLDARLQHPFLEYAITQWAYHASQYDTHDYIFFESISKFAEAKHASFKRWALEWTTRKALTSLPSKLHLAAFAGLTKYAESLLREGEDANALDGAERTPLQWACRRGHLAMVSLLLRSGAKPNENDLQGVKPIHEAAKRNYATIVRALLYAGVDPLTPKTCENHAGELLRGELSTKGQTAIEYVWKRGHKDTILVMLPFLKQGTAEEILCQCCRSGDYDAVDAILEKSNLSVNIKFNGETPLYLACCAQSLPIVQELLARGADANAVSDCAPRGRVLHLSERRPSPRTPLHGLILHNRQDWRDRDYITSHQILWSLVKAGADVDAKLGNGETALLGSFGLPIDLNKLAIRSLLEVGASVSAAVDPKGDTILHRYLKRERDLEFIKFLVESGCSVQDCGSNGQTALHVVLSSSVGPRDPIKLTQVVGYLIEEGARCDQKNGSGRTAMELAIMNRECDIELFRSLLQACQDMEARTRCLWIIGRETKEENLIFIKELVSSGVSLEVRDRYGRTPLISHVGSEKMFESLLECGAELNAVDSAAGRNSLHWLVSTLGARNSVERLRKLVEQGLDPLMLDYNGNSLLHIAASAYQGTAADVVFMKHLIEFGLSINAKNHLGETPMHIHIERGAVDLSGQSRSRRPHVHLLELFMTYHGEQSFDIDAQDSEDLTPLHVSAIHSEAHLARLLSAGADATILTKDGRSVLHLAAQARRSDLIAYLLSNPNCRLKINEPDVFGRTPLHYACTSGRQESVNYLLRWSAEVNIKDKSGRTPLHSCAESTAENRIWSLFAENNGTGNYLLTKNRYRPVVIKRRIRKPWYAISNGSGPIFTDHDTARVSGILKALVLAGANTKSTDSHGRTPLDLALILGCDEMITYFKSSAMDVQRHWGLENVEPKLQTEVSLRVRSKSPLCSLQQTTQKDILQRPQRFLTWLSPDDVEWIVQNGGDVTGEGSDFKQTSLLHTVASVGLTDIMEKLGGKVHFYDNAAPLLELVASKKDFHSYAGNVRPVLQAACQRKLPNLEMIDLLVHTFAVNVNAKALAISPESFSGLVEGPTALHLLAEAKSWWQLDAIKYLVKKGADIDARNEKGETPLHIACVGDTTNVMNGDQCMWNATCVELLLDLGCDPNILDNDGKSCLQKASASPEIMRTLLQRIGESAALKESALFSALQNFNAQALEIVLDTGVSPNIEDASNACRVHPNVKDQARLALFCASFPPPHNSSPFSNTIKDSQALVRLLIERGADLYAKLNDHETLIHYVFEHSEYEIICTFLEYSDRIDFDRRDQLGRTVFLAACKFTNALAGYRQKHWVQEGNGPAIKILAFQADFTAFDDEKRTALHLLLDNPEAEQDDILALMKHETGYRLLNQRDGSGFTPLHYALRSIRPTVCEVLVSMGAALLEPDPNGLTALHHIASQWFRVHRNLRHLQILPPEYYEGCIKLWDMFIQQGGDINARDNTNSPALFSFLASPPRDDYKDHDIDSSCHSVSFDKFLAKADLHARNDDGESALHIIARRKNTLYTKPKHDSKLFELMMAKGLDPLVEDKMGRSSLDVAAACEKIEILKLFQYHT